MRNQLKIVIAANCQAPAIAEIINNITSATESSLKIFDVIFCKPIYLLAHDENKEFIAALNQADVILFQPHKGGAKTPEWRTSKYWVNNTSAKHCISFPSIYFSGYNPELTYLRKPNGLHLNEGFVDYHDKRIIKLFLEGMPVEQIVENYQRFQPTQEEVGYTLNSTFQEMQAREKEFDLAIRLTTFIQNNFKKERLFYTFNHPANTVLYEVVRQLLELLDLKNVRVHSIEKDLLKYDLFPIVNSVQKYLHLEFKDEQSDYTIQNELLTKFQIVKRYYNVYKANHKLVEQAMANLPRTDWLERKKLIIHIGLSKTGTTSFQKNVYDLAPQLEQEGLLYPKAGLKGISHVKLVEHFSGFQPDAGLLQSFKDEVLQSKAKTILISCEGFEGFSYGKMCQMADQLKEYDVYILCAMRNRISWVRSYYSEVVKKALFTEDFSSLIRTTEASSNQSGGSLFARFLKNVQAKRYDKMLPRNHSVRSQFEKKTFYGSTLLNWGRVFLKERILVCNTDENGIWETIENVTGHKSMHLAKIQSQNHFSSIPSVLTIEIVRRFYLQQNLKNLNYDLASRFVVTMERMLPDEEKNAFNSYFESEELLKEFIKKSVDDEFILRINFGLNLMGFEKISNIRYLNPTVIDDLYQKYKNDIFKVYQSLGGQI